MEWQIKRDPNKKWAEACATEGHPVDTIETLAKKIRMDPKAYRRWLRWPLWREFWEFIRFSGILSKSTLLFYPFSKGEMVLVPNTIYVDQGGIWLFTPKSLSDKKSKSQNLLLGLLTGLTLGLNVLVYNHLTESVFQDFVEEVKKDYPNFCVKVRRGTTRKQALEALMDPAIWGYFFLGHGGPGTLFYCPNNEPETALFPNDLSAVRRNNHSLAVLKVWGCNFAKPSDNFDRAAEIVKPYGKVVGFAAPVSLVSQPPPREVDFLRDARR